MNRLLFLIICLFYLLNSCKNKKDNNSQIHNNYVDIVYHFDKTSDSQFCNIDSIHQTDCEKGNLYLTSNGNTIYHNYCLGTDTTTYCIGKYTMTDTTIVCIFNQDYIFAECTECDSNDRKQVNPNLGILKKEKHDKMILKKINCLSNLKYYVSPTDEQKQNTLEKIKLYNEIGITLQPFRGYVFSVSEPNETTDFKKRIKSIKVLNTL